MDRSEIPTSEVVTVEFDKHVATVWLDRPDQRNALAPDFWDEFPRIMEALGEDDETRAIVIAARGQTFSAGIDLKAFGAVFMDGTDGSQVADRMALHQNIKKLQGTFTSIAKCPKPVIAAIHGHCLGAGIDLITACDVRLASDDAIFSVRETQIAMVADVGTMQRLPKIVNPGYLAEVVYTGKDFNAQYALQMGLVTGVYPDAEAVLAAASAMATEIAANSPLAVQGSKAVLQAGEGKSVDEALDYVALWNAAFIQSNDFSEAVMAFLQKRPPEFTGR
ncbi:MAG: crotonase/enoyl-CoA hydratase family protein [Acidimicrobiia bacterium]